MEPFRANLRGPLVYRRICVVVGRHVQLLSLLDKTARHNKHDKRTQQRTLKQDAVNICQSKQNVIQFCHTTYVRPHHWFLTQAFDYAKNLKMAKTRPYKKSILYFTYKRTGCGIHRLRAFSHHDCKRYQKGTVQSFCVSFLWHPPGQPRDNHESGSGFT